MSATPPTDARRNLQRRDTSPRSGGRRPKLLRASATAPSITTSNASRNALADSQSSRRALEMLSKVAIVSGYPATSVIRAASPMSVPSRMSPTYNDHQEMFSASPASHNEGLGDIRPHNYAGRYYSFPSFDIYEPGQQDEGKDHEKSP
ncbi:hypothetical protein DL546_005405 [Coniochaeta pulveracea]|uniref:Uncharacterized protein n=1 Tax=Coniochaeta pulveracea TaxID=177199 RepID=A0A420YDK6_9PEZI|nr:hypothetical protein DL546_005405 [Coniochaeta pulveracea]